MYIFVVSTLNSIIMRYAATAVTRYMIGTK
jgi:hypothetical protein